MTKYGLIGGVLAVVLIGEMLSPRPASAGDGFVGGLVGGIIGGAMVGHHAESHHHTARRTTSRRPQATRTQRVNGMQRATASQSSGAAIKANADPFAATPTSAKTAP